MSTTTLVETDDVHTSSRPKSSHAAFTSIPILDLSLLDSLAGKRQFLSQLREALVVVGFFYFSNIDRWLPPSVQHTFVSKAKELCNLPLEKKLEIDMMNSKHFLGYSQMGKERTAREVDYREMFDFLSPVPAPGPDEPVYMNVQGPNQQWPDEKEVQGFRHALETYLAAVGKLGETMTILVAEALDLEATALMRFFGSPPRNKVSLLKYPEPPVAPPDDDDDDDFQGVGSHKDGGFLTYLLQATPHHGLEAQNKSGIWIPVPPIPNTLVVNVGRSLESITGGVCTATTHRVNLSARKFLDGNGYPLGPRFSFPVFQTLKMDLTSEEMASLKLPKHIRDLAADGERVDSDAEAYFEKYHLESPGVGIFTARLTSHPEVGRRWYPGIVEEILKGQAEFATCDSFSGESACWRKPVCKTK
ncbi:isopenicillin N synthase [Periconia macrospinosa]|uniref:Isopenicillin N synthase n=1 Tax=Periconia macrospinosa TaxID=97972 RepID=A0A2V1DX58_9PLEO|nr:isopenicillin N synthase [Periconia macrospinosa]